MTVVNPKSISGINSITTGSGSDDLLTIHTNNGTERLRIDSTGATKIVTGIVTTLTATTGIVTTLTANTVTSLGDVDIADKIIHTGDTNTAIRFPEADTITFETAGFEQVRIDNDVQMFVEANSKPTKLQIHREDASINADDVIGQITFTGRDSGGDGTQRVGAAISAIASNGWDTGQATGYSPAHLDFYTQANQGAYSTLTPRVRIDSSGRVLIGTTDVGGGNADDLTVATSGNTGITIRSGTSNTGNIFWSDATSGADQYIGALEYHHSDNQFKFNISNTTRMTVDSTGDVTVSDGDLVIGTSGHGIDFSATGNGGGTMSSELLDDYEEGTFTPTLPNGGGSVTFTTYCAKYIKIGDIVHIFCDIGGIANHQNLDLRIGGFPYTSSSTNATTATLLTGRADPGNGLTVNVFDSAAYGDVRSQFQSDGQKGQIFNGHGVHFNLTYLTN